MQEIIRLPLTVMVITVIAFAMQARAFAQHEGHGGMGVPSESVEKVQHFNYCCPMHPEVVSDNPGVCYKCQMNLEQKEVKNKSTENKNMYYSCMEHPAVRKNKKGKCEACGKKLKKKKIYSYE